MLQSIVFVHGLTGNRRNTWTHNDGGFWPQELLPKDLPTARIMTFGYDVDVVGIVNTAGSGTLRDHGKSLANDLAMRRARTNSTTRPLIFVAHSLGGLVVEQVREERDSGEIHTKNIFVGVVDCQRRRARSSEVSFGIDLRDCVYGNTTHGIDESWVG